MKYNFINADDYLIYPQYNIFHPLYAKLIKYKNLSDSQLADLSDDDKIYNTNPYEYKDMDNIVYILKMAIMNNDRIMVYGNFDVDGLCGTAIIVSLLQKIEARVSYYVPSRYNDGFGLNSSVLKAIRDKGFKVLITVDNGMESTELVRLARGYGMKVIIIDRHVTLGAIPMANAILNPKVGGMNESYTSTSYMCFRLAQALSGDSSRYYLSLSAIATIGANRPYIGSNYKIIKLGLKYMNHYKFKQLEILTSSPYIYTINTIKEDIIPKLEAISRAGKNVDMSLPLKMLLSEDVISLENNASILSGYSKKENKIKNKLVDEIVEDYIYKNEKFIFIVNENITESEGVPLADRLYFLYNVPTFILVSDYKNSEVMKGIAKSHSSFPMNVLFSKHQEICETFSGYATSATFTIKKEKVAELKDIIEDETFKTNIMSKEKIIDVIDVKEEEITLESVKELLMSGFSVYRNDTCFRIKNLDKSKLHRSLNGFHISGILNDNVTLVGYKIADEFEFLKKDKIDIIFRPEINEFNGKVNVSLRIYFIE